MRSAGARVRAGLADVPRTVDLLVVGLGVTGAGVALDAAARGLSVLAVPWTTVVVVLVGSGVVGVVAALLPAWRATRIDTLRAITTE